MPNNISFVAPPRWTGADGELAVVVSRGEPRRSDLHMEQAVAGQVQDYLLHHGRGEVAPVLVALVTQKIAVDHISTQDSPAVMLTREHLFAYAQVARTELAAVENSRAL